MVSYLSDYWKFSLLMLSVQSQATEHLKKKNQKRKKEFSCNERTHCLASSLFTGGIKKQNARKLLEHQKLPLFKYQSWCHCQSSSSSWKLMWHTNCGLSLDASLWWWNWTSIFVYVEHLSDSRRRNTDFPYECLALLYLTVSWLGTLFLSDGSRHLPLPKNNPFRFIAIFRLPHDILLVWI